jgi:hypothetical protein
MDRISSFPPNILANWTYSSVWLQRLRQAKLHKIQSIPGPNKCLQVQANITATAYIAQKQSQM